MEANRKRLGVGGWEVNEEISTNREDDEADEMMESRRRNMTAAFLGPLMMMGQRVIGSTKASRRAAYGNTPRPKVRKSKGKGGQGGKRG